MRGKVHVADESVSGLTTGSFPLTHTQGERSYIQAWPYILEPADTLTVDLSPASGTSGAIGEVVDATWTGLRHRRLGTAQAWSTQLTDSSCSGSVYLMTGCVRRVPSPIRS